MNVDSYIIHELQKLAQRYELEELILFGSRARGDNMERSDIDLAARFENAQQYLDFQDDLENIRTLLMCDVVNLSSDMISLDLRQSIKKEGMCIYEKV